MDCKGLLLLSICAPLQCCVVARDPPAHYIAGSEQQIVLVEVYRSLLGLQPSFSTIPHKVTWTSRGYKATCSTRTRSSAFSVTRDHAHPSTLMRNHQSHYRSTISTVTIEVFSRELNESEVILQRDEVQAQSLHETAPSQLSTLLCNNCLGLENAVQCQMLITLLFYLLQKLTRSFPFDALQRTALIYSMPRTFCGTN
jgi:hypothetical protein